MRELHTASPAASRRDNLPRVPGVERVHILRYGEGSAHLHRWFMARQTGLRQTASGFAMIWDDVLPPTPAGAHHVNVETIISAPAG